MACWSRFRANFCAYKQTIVIETGFDCPAAYPNKQSAGDFTVCSQQAGGLDAMQIDEVRDVLVDENGWVLEDPSPQVPLDMNPSFDTGLVNMGGDDGGREDMTSPRDRILSEKVDILWVIDNSFGMCEKQQVLRDSVSDMITPLLGKDFHIGITTTHAPSSVAGSIEPVAREAMLQSTPQPVPGNKVECRQGPGMNTAYAPLRDALASALECLADPSTASQYTWDESQIECALQSLMRQAQSGCVASSNSLDRNGDGMYDILDLFPDSSAYRSLPRVFTSADYTVAGAGVDEARLTADLRCAMLVGTRGDGYEKGLRVAVNAVSPANTGGALGGAGVDTTAPNHGLIREDSRFALVIMSDENDCSHDGTLMEVGSQCGASSCEYYNSLQVAESDSPLVPPDALATQLLSNLSASKLTGFEADDVFVATITGTAARFDQPLPDCSLDTPQVSPTCSSSSGESYSGDRYERFARQFPRHYPNTNPDPTGYEPVGLLCTPDFGPSFTAITAEIAK